MVWGFLRSWRSPAWPYGDLERQRLQRFATRAGLDLADCTFKERQEYEPHLVIGNIVYAGVDYGAIVLQAAMVRACLCSESNP